MKYPLSVQDSIHDGKMSVAFWNLLTFHVKSGSFILDPTAGSKLLWSGMPINTLNLDSDPCYEIVYSDIEGGLGNQQQNLSTVLEDRPYWKEAFDCVVYDPPYLIGENETDDPRQEQYSSYAYSLEELKHYMALVPSVIHKLLKPNGKLILKCSDQYVVPEKKFYMHHYEWLRRMTLAFTIIDIMIYRHHRMSPTAFQVKNRQSCVIMHSYYIVGVKNVID